MRWSTSWHKAVHNYKARYIYFDLAAYEAIERPALKQESSLDKLNQS